MQILHVFADRGAENPTLSNYGNVYRFTLNAYSNDYSEVVQCDANKLPIKDDVTFDIGWFHPPCGGVSPLSDTKSGSREDWPDLIPLSREIAQKHCEHWVIENKPRDSIDATVTLDGHMFNLGMEYKRAFECSFSVEQPVSQNKLAQYQPFFSSEHSKEAWAAAKGTDVDIASKNHLAKNTIPSAYIDYIMRHFYTSTDEDARPDYSNYDRDMDAKRSKEKNAQLEEFC